MLEAIKYLVKSFAIFILVLVILEFVLIIFNSL